MLKGQNLVHDLIKKGYSEMYVSLSVLLRPW